MIEILKLIIAFISGGLLLIMFGACLMATVYFIGALIGALQDTKQSNKTDWKD